MQTNGQKLKADQVSMQDIEPARTILKKDAVEMQLSRLRKRISLTVVKQKTNLNRI